MSTSHHPFDQEELMAFLDGELPAERAAGAAEHLKHCVDCQRLAHDFAQVSQAMVGWEVEAANAATPVDISLALDKRSVKGPGGVFPGWSSWRKFVGWRQLAWTGGLAIATLLIFAVSMPNLNRSKQAAEQSARAAQNRVKAEREEASRTDGSKSQASKDQAFVDQYDQYKVTTKKFGPEYGRNKGDVAGATTTDEAKPRKTVNKSKSANDAVTLYTYNGVPAPPPPPPARLAPGIVDGKVASAAPSVVFNGRNFWQEPAGGPAARQNAANNQQLAQAGAAGGMASALKQRSKSETVEVTAEAALVTPPMIIRTAELSITTKDFDAARTRVEEVLKRHQGYVGELNVNTPAGAARSLTGTLRVPASQLEAAIADLKAMGRVEQESQNGEEVTQQCVDLEARIKNSRNTEQRLIELQRERTGKLSDVLSVEMQISRVRGEIEQMEAQLKNMRNQVDYATVNLTVREDYKAELKVVPPSTGTLVRNAAVDGYKSLIDGLLALLLWLLSWLPSLLVWIAVLFFPARLAWRRLRHRFAHQELAV